MRSIRARLFLSSAAAVVLGGLAIVAVSYSVTLRELNEAGDEALKQVAVAMARYRDAGTAPRPITAPRWPLPTESRDDYDIVAMTWDAAGAQTYTSDPQVKLAPPQTAGASTLVAAGVKWHAFSIADETGVVLAAQRASARHIDAVESASSLLLPLLGLLAAMALALGVGLRRGLRPLHAASDEVTQRSATALEPLDVAQQPREIQPLILAINQLMQRVATAFEVRQRFVFDAAHGLRSPVTALRLQLQLFERATEPQARQAALAQVRAGTARVQRLIAQLLDLSVVDHDVAEAALARVDLAQIARSVMATSMPIADEGGIDLGLDAPAPAWIDGDAMQLALLLGNLVENALRYTPRGGVVDVSVRIEADDHVVLDVIDNGPGIPAAERDRVFDRFYRGSTAADHATGSGLGLAIVKAVAERHGADVTLQDASSGQGLQVRVGFAQADAANFPVAKAA